jgi:hypothetical protein
MTVTSSSPITVFLYDLNLVQTFDIAESTVDLKLKL